MASHIYPIPQGESLAAGYSVLIDGQPAPLRQMRVSAAPINRRWPGHQREIAQSELAGFVSFSMEGQAMITVEADRDFERAVIRPLSKGVKLTRQGRRLSFALTEPGGYTLELDGPHHALHILADPPEQDAVSPEDPNVLYFGPGIHERGVITLTSNQTLYLDEGAVLYATVEAKDVEHVRIMGRGILDNSHNKEEILFQVEPPPAEGGALSGVVEDGDDICMGKVGSFDVGNARRANTIDIRDCRGLTIEGITIRDSLVYNIALLGCVDVHIDRVKIIGCWRYNSDGIDLHNCQRIHIENCFIRTYDDALCIKGNFGVVTPEGKDEKPVYSQDCRDYLAENCVIWCDWGRCLEIGAETRVEEIDHIVFRNCDIIRACHIVMDVQNVDYAHVHDVLFEDIRVEYDGASHRPYLQVRDGEAYPERADDSYMPELMCAIVYQHPEYSGGLNRRGRNRHIVFRNIDVTAPEMPPSTFQGFDDEHDTRDILIENLRLNGKAVTTLEAARVKVMDFARDIVIR